MSKLERNQHPAFQVNEAEIMSRWDKEYGDRINELVFIGQDMAKAEIMEELEACLCSEEEYEAYKNGTIAGDRWPIYTYQNETATA